MDLWGPERFFSVFRVAKYTYPLFRRTTFLRRHTGDDYLHLLRFFLNHRRLVATAAQVVACPALSVLMISPEGRPAPEKTRPQNKY